MIEDETNSYVLPSMTLNEAIVFMKENRFVVGSYEPYFKLVTLVKE